MRNIDFSNIKDIEGIAKYFYADAEFVKSISNSKDQKEFYKELKIAKKGNKNRGKFRTVYKGCSQVSQLQKEIAASIDKIVDFPSCVQGFVKKRSTTSNAKEHLAKNFLLNADIKDFFDCISINQVFNVFISLGCDKKTADVLAKICTINGVLCQGLHTSPVLSNMVVKDFDTDIQLLAEKYSANYTRYGDDITISSQIGLPSKEEIVIVLGKYGFILNEDKFRISKRGQSQYVTGLSVFDSKYPRVPKRFKRNIRLSLYYINKYGLESHFNKLEIPGFAESFYMRRLKGYINYVNAVEPKIAVAMNESLPIEFSDLTDIEELSKILVMGPVVMTKKLYEIKIKELDKFKDHKNKKIKEYIEKISNEFREIVKNMK